MPKINFSTARKVVVYSVFISLFFLSGYILGINGFRLETASFPKVEISRTIPKIRQDVNFSLFWRVWDTLDSSYFDKTRLDPAKMVYGAISGMVGAVGDPYTAFLPPDENKIVEEDLSGSFEGIGIHIGFIGKQLAVIAPMEGSPAEDAGIVAGDYIVGISDKENEIEISTVGITLNDAVEIIRGKAGSKVTLFLLREGKDESIEIEIERKKIDVPSVSVSFVGKSESIAHIKLLKFGEETYDEWKDAVLQITENNPSSDYNSQLTGIVLDLRNNPGGYLQAAVDISGDFVDLGSVVVVEDKRGEKNEFKSSGYGKLKKYNMVILVNKGSASASEILAGALRDINNTKLIGTKTFGKGTIQEPIQMDNGASLHITTAKWLTPKSFWVNEKGLEPDVIIEDNKDTEEDEQLQEAINLLENL